MNDYYYGIIFMGSCKLFTGNWSESLPMAEFAANNPASETTGVNRG
jgi:hypothetical protein